MKLKSISQQIFSVKNIGNHKVVNIFGIKIKFKKRQFRKPFKHRFFEWNNDGLPLIDSQKKVIEQFNQKVKIGQYKLEPNYCLCGHKCDKLIAKKDRYGVDINTYICKHCGLIRSNPYYTQETLNDFYNNEYRNWYILGERDDEKFFENQHNIGKNYLANIEKFLNKSLEGETVYEIGCGMGGILKAFKDKICTIKGVDLGEEYINIGRDKYNLDLEAAEWQILKKYQKADILILSHVLEHITTPIDFLKDIREIIKDEGLLYVAVPTIEVIPLWYQNNIFHYLQNAHIYNFSNETLQYVLEMAGFHKECAIVEQGTIIAKKVNSFRKLKDVPEDAYKINMNRLIEYADTYEMEKHND